MMKNKPSPPTLLFLHIPKTAGTTLHHILMRQYPENQQYTAEFWTPEAVEKFGRLPAEKKAALRIVWGHFSYGLHQQTPYPTAYFTFLRDPIDRVLSHYYYHLNRPDIFELKEIMETEKLTMHQVFAQRKILDIENMQTRLLAGLPYHFPPAAYTAEHLEMAKENLKKNIAVIGLVEQFDASLLLLKQAFGWEDICYARRNVTKKRASRDQIPPETIALITEQESLDIQLYAYAQELFAEQLAQQPLTFGLQVKKFQTENRVDPAWKGLHKWLNQSPRYVRTRHKITYVKQKVLKSKH